MQKKDKTSFGNDNVFAKELQIFEKSLDIIQDQSISKEELLQEYTNLAKHYGKLLKGIGKITKIGDAYQKKLKIANGRIGEQNEMLKTINKELMDAYQKIEIIAKTDPLTKLWNRRAMFEKLNDEKKRFEQYGENFSILLCDIDHFKLVNDTYGHDFGDFLLSSLSCLFQNNLRKNDEVARWGGEEFIFLLSKTDSEVARFVAESIRQKIEHESFTYKDQKLSVTMSFGVSSYNQALGLEECIKQADIALYKGKTMGRNRVVVYKD
ncbi:MAG: GGDEF domain-containing protein [Leptospiraceae bacterium]|nr:GGDEF domain-containing protein [Leptospiraceae bacterium]